MKLIQKPDDEWTGWSNYRVSENGIVHMGVYRVMYGFRVRAGFTRDKMGCTLDWCGGGDWKNVERLYSLCAGVLSHREEDEHCFEGVPGMSAVKPFHLDREFTEKVIELAGDFEIISLSPTPITILEVGDSSGRGLHELL